MSSDPTPKESKGKHKHAQGKHSQEQEQQRPSQTASTIHEDQDQDETLNPEEGEGLQEMARATIAEIDEALAQLDLDIASEQEGEDAEMLEQLEEILTLHEHHHFLHDPNHPELYDPFYVEGEDPEVGVAKMSELIREIDSILDHAAEAVAQEEEGEMEMEHDHGLEDAIDEMLTRVEDKPEAPSCSCKKNKSKSKKKTKDKKVSSEFDGKDIAEILRQQSETDFLEIMEIPEEPAIEEMERMALMEDVKDLLAKFHEEDEEEVLHGEPRPHTSPFVAKSEIRAERCPSIESFFRQSGQAEVHMYLYPGKKMFSREVRLDTTVTQLKHAVARYVHVPAEVLDIRQKHHLLANHKMMSQLGAKPGKTLKFTVEVNQTSRNEHKIAIKEDPRLYPEEVFQRQSFVAALPHLDRPDSLIALQREDEEEPVKITVVHPTDPNPHLGGYFDKSVNKYFADAATQVKERDLKDNDGGFLYDKILNKKKELIKKAPSEKENRACQTQGTHDLSLQTLSTHATQTDTCGEPIYISCKNDKILYPTGEGYRNADILLDERERAAIVIQKFWRTFLAKRRRANRMSALMARVAWVEKFRAGRMDKRMRIMEEELERQKNPRRMVDIELIYREITNWREEQEEYLRKNRWGAELKAGLAYLMEMEGDLLLDLERLKHRILNAGERDNMLRQLEIMGRPRRWYNPTLGVFLTFDTEGRKRCKRLADLFKELTQPVKKTEEGKFARLRLISTVQKVLLEDDLVRTGKVPLANMLTDLFLREMKFMSVKKGVDNILVGIRRRIVNTFFYLCRDPSFNPEAKRIDKTPYNSQELLDGMVQCKGCRKMQHREQFTIVKGTTLTQRCLTCSRLYRTAVLRMDLNLYRQLLSELREDEFQLGVVNSVTFLIDEYDMRVIVEQLWLAQSVLSGNDNRYMLRVCRWKKNEPWSPWNCILLTEEEAIAHLHLEDLESAYTPELIQKVQLKQAQAKIYFKGLAKHRVELDDRISKVCGNLRSDDLKRKEEMRARRHKFMEKLRERRATLGKRSSYAEEREKILEVRRRSGTSLMTISMGGLYHNSVASLPIHEEGTVQG